MSIDKKIDTNDCMPVTSDPKDDREKYVNNVKTELRFFNYGLPPDPDSINKKAEDIIKKYRAVHELWVRLNVFIATGKTQKGTIMFPESNRVIDYFFCAENLNDSYVRFRSLRHYRPDAQYNLKAHQ